ncbi:uncharacterized protein Z520_00535 [Fonsecaea multimorphosa CBS 102226]|uniref:TATA element modulatory factor 1 TATA binding domain-containing protein n=1 Tax=Fonsecaea multimorphosa CBS 102226 TaxID=1442371 RepID=A0A0D2L449_9EURO|nr:uncharacterized protein Z520_00535 [Fonsecaea multimorphosa CBS 102226]KIY03844.1 hypothetical protein Z520_00535 [Fonsecaea multimorphosa CBS 102226]OAL32533.1 hypothetical protein AYO22_00555 [Fonsecaea multimorphosa]
MTSKPGSRWNFLQQAVASVESRLDDILAEEGDRPKRTHTPTHNKKPSSDLSRSSSTASASNDRLQERLARAMAKKNASRTESPVPSQEQSPRPVSRGGDASASVSDIAKVADPSPSIYDQTDIELRTSSDVGENARQDLGSDKAVSESTAIAKQERHRTAPIVMEQPDLDSARPSAEILRDGQTMPSRLSEDVQRTSEDDGSNPYKDETMEMQEEINTYLERIDALRRNLEILGQEVAQSAQKAADSARQAAASAEAGSLEQKISQKDAEIAVLIEEGTRWSKTEMDLRSMLKKVRSQALTNAKEQEAARLRADRAERALRAMEDRARKAEAANKRAEQTLAANAVAAKDVEAMRKERDALNATLAEMKSQLSKANMRAEAAESKVQSEQLEKERRKIVELEDDLTVAKVEHELSEGKLRKEIQDLRSELEKQKEQTRTMESEMLSEQAALESKLESFRVRAEVASSADHGHAQAKLLRQIEILQTQYTTASQNWQGIESSLLGRITNLEKERDEVVGREAELRKKLRDATLKLKNVERELANTQSNYADMDKSLADAIEEARRQQRKVSQLETDLANALKDLEEQKGNSEKELQRRIDEEKSKWTAASHVQRTDSPATSIRKSSGLAFDINHLMSPTQFERGSSRRPSIMPNTFDSNTPPRQQSTTSFRGLANGSIAETPSVVTSMDPDEYFANVPPTPITASQHSQRGGLNDLVSTSTVGAGPSVQLVERMSANVRRLESEKAASKDELARLTTQRDEARQEVVGLMREVETKRKIEKRLEALEKEHAILSARHQTTLELLGEKTEQVEELKADIVDVKQMYRQLADTMK